MPLQRWGGDASPPVEQCATSRPPLRNSAIYYPLLPSVATTQLNYLRKSLSHPSVTGPLSFHSIVLSTNHALRLDTDVIRGQRVQRTHVFNASLAELQGLDGIPISSRVGHAVILFFPGEHEREFELDKEWDDLLKRQIACLNPEETGLATPAYEEDSEDEDRANGPGVLIQSLDRIQDVNGDGRQEGDTPAVRRRNSYPPDGNTNPETRQPPDTILDESESSGNESQDDNSVQSYVYRVNRDNQGELVQETLPIPIPRGLRRIPPPPHPALPFTFILPVQQIISVKHDEARGVFRVPRDYSLRMSIDEEELRLLKRGLPLLIAVRLDFIVRTLARVSNERGSALILHNPVYLDMIHRMLYPRRIDMYSPPMAHPLLEMPQFRPTVYVLETYEPTEVDSSQSSSDDSDDHDKKSKRGEDEEDDDPESSEWDRTTSKRRRVETQEEGDRDQLMYPATPLAATGMESNCSFKLSKELTNFVNITDESFRPPTPIPSMLLQPPVQALSSLEPTSMPSTVAAEISASTTTPNIFVTQLQIIHIPPADLDIEMGEATRHPSINPAVMAPEGQH